MSVNDPRMLRAGWGGPDGRPGRLGLFFIGIWTLFLVQPLEAGWDRRDSPAGWIGMAATLLFTAWYLLVFARRRLQIAGGQLVIDTGAALLRILVAIVLAVVVCATVGEDGSATAVYLSVLFAMTLPNPLAPVLAVINALAWYVAGFAVPGWTTDAGLLLSTLAATLAVWGIQQMITRNAQLMAAREENAQLAVEDERNRFARDLHDILGHSLTVITVKAELANRLFEVDRDRAKAEIEDLERLARDALADVRRAVEGYRELTLPGEIARARMALEAAEIRADLPNSTDDVPTELRELFAWTVREGVTNVIRHSGAQTCTVRLTPASAEVIDDGRGGKGGGGALGNGLVGLRERASAVGAEVSAAPADGGFALRVTVA
ncbi:sensor histidine kinase [Nocardioides ultimimeridianus]